MKTHSIIISLSVYFSNKNGSTTDGQTINRRQYSHGYNTINKFHLFIAQHVHCGLYFIEFHQKKRIIRFKSRAKSMTTLWRNNRPYVVIDDRNVAQTRDVKSGVLCRPACCNKRLQTIFFIFQCKNAFLCFFLFFQLFRNVERPV